MTRRPPESTLIPYTSPFLSLINAKAGHGPILPMLSYLKSDDFKNSPPQVLIWEFPERYLPVNNEIGDADPAWVAQLKQAGSRQQNMAINTSKSETPDRAQN